jgi:glycerol-3-phosphate O-acyltransferase
VSAARVLLLAAGAGAAALALGAWIFRPALDRWARRTIHQFRARLDRYKLVSRRETCAELLRDPAVLAAARAHAAAHGMPAAAVLRQVERYIEEIVPHFNVLSYYQLGYNLSRLLVHSFYRPTVARHDAEPLNRIPKGDVVVYLMNHRSNADYVVVTWVLGHVVAISWAVGEWARTWPLEYVFKSFGSYFVRRRFREPLYHTVLERYVQLITRNRVTQGIFPEGGLTRDGTLRPPKLGLLDYIVGTLRDPDFDGDIWLVPVGINYDRVFEDRTLIRELVVGVPRRSRFRQAAGVLSFAGSNIVRLLTFQLRRYGRVAVAFGSPISVRGWVATEPAGVLGLPRAERLPRIAGLAAQAMERIGAMIPVTPVCLGAAALLSFPGSLVRGEALLERLEEFREELIARGATLVHRDLPVEEVWDRAWRTFRMRGLLLRDGASYVILPSARPLLTYYANAIRHLLPARAQEHWSPVAEDDPSLPRLADQPAPPAPAR